MTSLKILRGSLKNWSCWWTRCISNRLKMFKVEPLPNVKRRKWHLSVLERLWVYPRKIYFSTLLTNKMKINNRSWLARHQITVYCPRNLWAWLVTIVMRIKNKKNWKVLILSRVVKALAIGLRLKIGYYSCPTSNKLILQRDYPLKHHSSYNRGGCSSLRNSSKCNLH